MSKSDIGFKYKSAVMPAEARAIALKKNSIPLYFSNSLSPIASSTVDPKTPPASSPSAFIGDPSINMSFSNGFPIKALGNDQIYSVASIF